MNPIIWSNLVRGHYYVVEDDGYLEFGIRILGNYIVTWPLPDFIEKDVLNLTKMPWDLYKEFYNGVSPTKVYRIKENEGGLVKVDVAPCITIDAPEIPLTPVYTVLARRWGSQEGHTYLVGTSGSKEGALELGKNEEYLRGGKYKIEIYRGYLESDATEILKNE